MDQNDQQQPDAEDGLATSFFPLPPAAYKNFTSRNFKLLKLIQEHEQDEDQQSWDELDAQQRMERQRAIIQEHGSALTKAKGGDEAEEAPQLPDWDLRMELEKPRVDWVVEDGFYNTFGQTWPIPERHPSLEEMGIKQLYPADSIDRRQVLQTLLQTILHTHLSLTDTLLRPPAYYLTPDGQQERTDADDKLDHIRTAVVNMQHLLNELRPVQARETLKLMMRVQLDRRKSETALIRRKCASMREMIQEMRTTMGADLASPLDIDTGKPATDSVWAFGKSAMASALKSEGAAVSQGERIATGEAMEVD